MTVISREPVYKRRQKVVAAVDLPHIPAGTKGRVLHPVGVTWFRYHVEFENGEVVSSLDATQLMTVDEWEKKEYDEREAARKAERLARREQQRAATAGGTT